MVRHPYPVTVRLHWIMGDRWGEIDAAYHASPVPLMKMSASRRLGFVHVWCLERIAPAKLSEWQADMVDILPWQTTQSTAAEALESESFFAMQSKGNG